MKSVFIKSVIVIIGQIYDSWYLYDKVSKFQSFTISVEVVLVVV